MGAGQYFWLGMMCAFLILLGAACISEIKQRQHWQDCAGVYHEECMNLPDFQSCEYEYYKVCVNEGT
jgi:hypothetical protein